MVDGPGAVGAVGAVVEGVVAWVVGGVVVDVVAGGRVVVVVGRGRVVVVETGGRVVVVGAGVVGGVLIGGAHANVVDRPIHDERTTRWARTVEAANAAGTGSGTIT